MEPSESIVICLPSAVLATLPLSLCACLVLTATDDCICENTSSNNVIECCSGAFDISMERSSDICVPLRCVVVGRCLDTRIKSLPSC